MKVPTKPGLYWVDNGKGIRIVLLRKEVGELRVFFMGTGDWMPLAEYISLATISWLCPARYDGCYE